MIFRCTVLQVECRMSFFVLVSSPAKGCRTISKPGFKWWIAWMAVIEVTLRCETSSQSKLWMKQWSGKHHDFVPSGEHKAASFGTGSDAATGFGAADFGATFSFGSWCSCSFSAPTFSSSSSNSSLSSSSSALFLQGIILRKEVTVMEHTLSTLFKPGNFWTNRQSSGYQYSKASSRKHSSSA